MKKTQPEPNHDNRPEHSHLKQLLIGSLVSLGVIPLAQAQINHAVNVNTNPSSTAYWETFNHFSCVSIGLVLMTVLAVTACIAFKEKSQG